MTTPNTRINTRINYKIRNRNIKFLRYSILIIFLFIVTIEAYLHQVLGGGEAASIHALCPYGALESLYNLIFGGSYIDKIFSGTLVLLIITIIIALIFRRGFCGLICPFGTIQELFGKLGKIVFKRSFNMPKLIDWPLRYLKYAILLITLYFAWKTSGLWMDSYDPWAAYGHISAGYSSLREEYLIGLILLIITLAGSLLYDRFFCKYLCPMGAFYAIVSKLSPSKITRDTASCIDCKICDSNCPVNIKISKATEIKSAECINCQACILSCPKDETLKFSIINKSLKPLAIIIIVTIIFIGGILGSKLIGIYQTTPPKLTSSSSISASEIKGYMTLDEVSAAFKIELKEFYLKLGIPESVAKNTKLKDIKNYVPGFEVSKVRDLLEDKN